MLPMQSQFASLPGLHGGAEVWSLVSALKIHQSSGYPQRFSPQLLPLAILHPYILKVDVPKSLSQ